MANFCEPWELVSDDIIDASTPVRRFRNPTHEEMKRSAKLSLNFATDAKRQQVMDLLVAYRTAVNFYIGLCWEQRGGYNAVTLRKIDSPLSYRYKGQALKQAVGIVNGTKKSDLIGASNILGLHLGTISVPHAKVQLVKV